MGQKSSGNKPEAIAAKTNVKSEFDAKYTFFDLAFNLRPTEITGYLGKIQLEYLEQNIRKREENFRVIKKIAGEKRRFCSFKYQSHEFRFRFSFPFVCKTAKLRGYPIKEFAGAGSEMRPMMAGRIQLQPLLPSIQILKMCCQELSTYTKLRFIVGTTLNQAPLILRQYPRV